MLPSSLSFEDDEEIQELTTVRSGGSDRRKLDELLVERFGDILTHQKHYLNVSFSMRRDWQLLRAWKAITGREQRHIMEQLIKYPLFYDYANFLLGRSYSNFLSYLDTKELTTGEVDEIARWRALQLTVVSTKTVTDENEGNYIGYNVICEIKADETIAPKNPADSRSRSWVACKRFREFRQLHLKLKTIHKNLAKLNFPSRTFMRSDTGEEVVSRRREELNQYLEGVSSWIKQESPWVKGDTVSREWIQCTEALEEFLSISEMAMAYPKREIDPNSDRDFALHPTVRSEDWFTSLQKREETELYLSQTRMSLQGLAYIFEQQCSLSLVDLIGITSDPDEFVSFLRSLVGTASLKQLFLGDVNVGDISKAVECMVDVLEHPQNHIELLLLAGWNMGEQLSKFSSSLSHCKHLRVLDLSHCGIDGIQTGMVELCSSLRNSSLQELYLDENAFGDDGAKILSVALRQNPALEVLSLKFCKITPFGIINILDALDHSTVHSTSEAATNSVNSNLVQLSIVDMTTEGEDYKITRDLAIQCSSTLENNNSLKELDLSGHYFNTESGLIIMRALQQNQTLKKLNLSYSKRNWNSDQLLLEFFQSNQSVTSLHLRNHMPTTVNEDETKTDHLVYSIPNDDLLRELFVWNMTDEAFSLLCQGLATNSCLELLDLQAMQLTESSVPSLVQMLEKNGTIQELLVRSSEKLDLSDLFSVIMRSPIVAISISNATREQAELFIHFLEQSERLPFSRISVSFTNGAVHCDLWKKIDSFLDNSPEQLNNLIA